MNIFELFGSVTLKGQEKVQQQLSKTEETAKKVSAGLKIAGAAFTAVGVAGLAMIDKTKKINAQLGVTALNLGISTKEMRALTLAVTNVTFPIDEVTASFDLLARAGVKDTEVLKATATAFDTLGDATGNSASQVTQVMVPAMKTFRLSAEEIASKTDMMTYMVRNSTTSLEDFNTMVGYTSQDMVDAGLTIDDMAAAMMYMSDNGVEPGKVMLREWNKAVALSAKEGIALTEALGMTSAELETYKGNLAGATGMTQEYADVANEQYTIMDKVKQKFSELTLGASGFLEPLEPMLVLMTALGPIMLIFAVNTKIATAAVHLFGAAWKIALGPIGWAILAVGALTAAGIWMWKNWDKVVDFFKGAWIDIKIAFAEGVKFIANTVLLPFVEMVTKEIGAIAWAIGQLVGIFDKELGDAIGRFADKMLHARQEITAWADDLAAGARVEKSIRDTEKALEDTAEATSETDKEVKNLASSLGEDLPSALGLTAQELEEATEKAEALTESLRYQHSEAGQLGITMRDIYDALWQVTHSTQEVEEAFLMFGDSTENLDGLLSHTGLTLQTVAILTGDLQAATDSLNESVGKSTSLYSKWADTIMGKMSQIVTWTSEAISAWDYYGMTPAAQAAMALGSGIQYGDVTRANLEAQVLKGWAEMPPGGNGDLGAAWPGVYDNGGVIPGRIGESILIKARAGETILPTHKAPIQLTVHNDIYLDGKLIGQSVINKLTREVRLQGGT